MRTTERIRRVDSDMIEYRITIDDPDTYTARPPSDDAEIFDINEGE